MLKSLVILAVFFAVQAPQNIPGQRSPYQTDTSSYEHPSQNTTPAFAQLTVQPTIVSQPDKGKDEDKESESKPGYWREAFGPAYIGNWFLVFVGGIAGFLAWRTLNAIGRQANLLERQILSAESSSEKQLRAYVHIDSALLKFPEPGVPEAQIHFKNCGQTPAYDVRGWIHTWFVAHPLTEELPTPESDFVMAREPLAPGRVSVFVAPKKPPLQNHLLQWLGTPLFTLYIYGEVRYTDAFGKERFTKYRLIYGGPEGVRKAPKKGDTSDGWILNPDTAGNESN